MLLRARSSVPPVLSLTSQLSLVGPNKISILVSDRTIVLLGETHWHTGDRCTLQNQTRIGSYIRWLAAVTEEPFGLYIETNETRRFLRTVQYEGLPDLRRAFRLCTPSCAVEYPKLEYHEIDIRDKLLPSIDEIYYLLNVGPCPCENKSVESELQWLIDKQETVAKYRQILGIETLLMTVEPAELRDSINIGLLKEDLEYLSDVTKIQAPTYSSTRYDEINQLLWQSYFIQFRNLLFLRVSAIMDWYALVLMMQVNAPKSQVFYGGTWHVDHLEKLLINVAKESKLFDQQIPNEHCIKVRLTPRLLNNVFFFAPLKNSLPQK